MCLRLIAETDARSVDGDSSPSERLKQLLTGSRGDKNVKTSEKESFLLQSAVVLIVARMAAAVDALQSLLRHVIVTQ